MENQKEMIEVEAEEVVTENTEKEETVMVEKPKRNWKKIGKNVLIGAGGLLAAAGTAAIGYLFGKRKGADEVLEGVTSITYGGGSEDEPEETESEES